jgi:hypothetical protein
MKHVVRLPAGGLFVQTRKEDIMDLPIRNAAVPPVAVVPRYSMRVSLRTVW